MLNRPLFVVGVSRSGTSLLHGLLDAHPAIRLTYESRLISEGPRRFGKRRLRTWLSLHRVLLEISRLEATEEKNLWLSTLLSEEEYAKELFGKFGGSSEPFRDCVEDVYQKLGPVSCWGDKTLRIERTEYLLDFWPNARFVALVRDPRAIYASQIRRFPFRRLRAFSIYFNVHCQVLLRRREERPEQFLIVRYEDLAQRPEETISRILAFSGIESDVGKELVFAEAKSVTSSSCDRWRDDLENGTVAELESLCFDSMNAFGYSPGYTKGQQNLSALIKFYEVVRENLHRLPLNPVDWYRKRLFSRLMVALRGGR